MSKKISKSDITEDQKKRASEIVREVVAWQSEQTTKEDEERTARAMYALMGERFPTTGSFAGQISSLRSSLRSSLYSSLELSLELSLRSSLRSSLDSSLHSSMRSNMLPSLRWSLDSSLRSSFYLGTFWSYWAARYSIAKALGAQFDDAKFQLFINFSRHCPIAFWAKEFHMVLPKPHKVQLVEVGETQDDWRLPIFELHAESETSVELGSEIKLYHFHNIQIPERMGRVMREKWQPEWILDEKNSEVRRLLIENIGMEKIFEALKGESISRWKDYELFKLPIDDGEDIHMLKMVCPSTGRMYIEGVPPSISDAQQAFQWQWYGEKEKVKFEWHA